MRCAEKCEEPTTLCYSAHVLHAASCLDSQIACASFFASSGQGGSNLTCSFFWQARGELRGTP